MCIRDRKREREEDSSSAEWKELSPGVVLLSSFLTGEEQREMARVCLPLVEGSALCKTEVTKNMKQVTIGKQKKAQGGVVPIPEAVSESAKSACTAACTVSDTLCMLRPRTCVLNWYPPKGKLGRHVDKPGRRRGVPVVSFSIGSAAQFVFQKSWSKKHKPQTVVLRSGDALVFGGPAESIVHSVPNIHPAAVDLGEGTVLKGRLNVTVREH
eukprot:TRINITY_DN29949_c0_g1_i1.p1 TRINITY_DN29949_c0_g1~~TRINITY_DN29949_c0_g1_i1.p1  ORF type:complete len:212 (-),score=41.57 TRINITY_DN29949_c0_g1_i1:364-999(-)